MVALAQRVDAIPCAHDLEAAVRELRLIAEHKPRYNRRSRFPERALWVRLTEEPFPRLSVVRRVRPGAGVFLGPFPDRRAADAAVAAVHESLPLRQCTTRISARAPAGAACALAEMGRCGAPCTGAQSVDGVRVDRRGLPGRGRPATRATSWPRCSPGSTGWPPRSATRTPRCCATASPSWSGPCAAGSGWSRWPPSPSWSWPGPTAPAAGTCPSSAAAGWWPPVRRRAARRSAARWPACWRPPRPCSARTASMAASVDETELVLRWMEKPGTRLVELAGTLACPAPGTGAFNAFLARVESGRTGRDPFADGRSLGTRARPERVTAGVGGRPPAPASIAGVITAIVMIDAATDSIPEVAAAIADLDGVSEVYSTAGEVDLIAIVRVREFEQIAEVIAGPHQQGARACSRPRPTSPSAPTPATTSRPRSRSASRPPTERPRPSRLRRVGTGPSRERPG